MFAKQSKKSKKSKKSLEKIFLVISLVLKYNRGVILKSDKCFLTTFMTTSDKIVKIFFIAMQPKATDDNFIKIDLLNILD